MAENTKNYGLVKPAQTDFYNIDVFNSNADTVDTALDSLALKLDDLQIGSRNYAQESVFISNTLWKFTQTSATAGNSYSIADGVATLTGKDTTWKQLQIYSNQGAVALSNLEFEKTYTLSVDVYVENVTTNGNIIIQLRSNSTTGTTKDPIYLAFNSSTLTTGTWNRITATGTIPVSIADHSYWRIMLVSYVNGTAKFRRPKLELGNKATDWTEAPEDVFAAIAANTASITTAQATADTAIGKITTKSDGDTTFRLYAAGDTSLLTKLLSLSKGMHTFYVQAGVTDNPVGSYPVRGMVHWTDTGTATSSYIGWVCCWDNYSNMYTNYHDGTSGWRGWQTIANTNDVAAAKDLANAKAPTNHASSGTTYGVGTSTSYGHLRLSDSTALSSGVSGGYAASPTAVKSAYDLAAAAVPKTGGTMTGQLVVSSGGLVVGSASDSLGTNAMVQGLDCCATGGYAIASGLGSIASGSAAIAEGYDSTASGAYSHASGYATVAAGSGATTFGMQSVANGFLEIAGGRWNKPSTYSAMTWSSAGNALVLGNGTNLGTANSFRVTNAGAVYALSAFNSTGADYAEYFEWADGNPDDEDRVGRFVTLKEGKIRIADDRDRYILGIVSAVPGVLGNSYEDGWQGMYLTDAWGRPQYEYVETEDGTEYRLALNPDYDAERSYVPRSGRPEWAPIGLLGQLLVHCDEQCRVGGFCLPNELGYATAAEAGYPILEIRDGIARVLFR